MLDWVHQKFETAKQCLLGRDQSGWAVVDGARPDVEFPNEGERVEVLPDSFQSPLDFQS